MRSPRSCSPPAEPMGKRLRRRRRRSTRCRWKSLRPRARRSARTTAERPRWWPITRRRSSPRRRACLKKIYVEEGDTVKAGQLLAQLDDADARSKLASGDCADAQGGSHLRPRREAAIPKQLIPQFEYEQDKFDLQDLRAALEAARLQLAVHTHRRAGRRRHRRALGQARQHDADQPERVQDRRHGSAAGRAQCAGAPARHPETRRSRSRSKPMRCRAKRSAERSCASRPLSTRPAARFASRLRVPRQNRFAQAGHVRRASISFTTIATTRSPFRVRR